MRNKNNIISLESLALKPYFILFDTSVLLNYYASNNNPQNPLERFIQSQERYNFFILMQHYVKTKGNFYITPLILREIQNRKGYSLKKQVKLRGNCGNKELLRFYRQKEKTAKELRSLQRVLQDNNKILDLRKGKKRMYKFFYNRNIKLKEKYGLSEADFDFLISGIVLAKTKGTLAFVSNDGGIFYARNDVLKKENLWFKKVKFFVREGFLNFKKMK